MQAKEYGTQHRETILLLHGGGLSWWNYREVAELLCHRYQVVLPILDGHAGSDAPFVTIEQNAREIIEWVDEHLGGQVLLMGGVSLGGQIVVEILTQRPQICRYAVIESALVFPMRLTHALVKPTYALCYPLIRRRWFARLQFCSLHIKPELFEEYYRDTAGISQKNLIAFLEANANARLKEDVRNCRANTFVVAGSRELPVMKRSAKAIACALPCAKLEIIPGYTHGALSLNHASQYVDKLLALLKA
ncbi:MAG: alpha/beta hydrolase [Clostridiales bacterium]|nr:alpha/beta hydrolase [Clostridiales bacterium]